MRERERESSSSYKITKSDYFELGTCVEMPILYNGELFYKGNKLNISKYLFAAYGYYYFFFRQWIWRVLKDTEGPCQRIDGACFENESYTYITGYGYRWRVGSVFAEISPLYNDEYVLTIAGAVRSSYRGNFVGLIDYSGYYADDLISPIYVYHGPSYSGAYNNTWSRFAAAACYDNQKNGNGNSSLFFITVLDSRYQYPDKMNSLINPIHVSL